MTRDGDGDRDGDGGRDEGRDEDFNLSLPNKLLLRLIGGGDAACCSLCSSKGCSTRSSGLGCPLAGPPGERLGSEVEPEAPDGYLECFDLLKKSI